MDKTIWYEVRFCEWSPLVVERLVVKETASMIIYETTSKHWPTCELVTHQTRARKVSSGSQFFSQKEDAIDTLSTWLKFRADLHSESAQAIVNLANNIKIAPIPTP
jgi:head-tail adaptor